MAQSAERQGSAVGTAHGEPASTDADEKPCAPQGGGLSFREERPWSWQQVSELSLPGLMSDNWQADDGR
jgi:hypothetical protein